MDAPAPLPPEVLATLPPAVVAFIQWQSEQIVRLTTHIAKQDARLAKLEAKLGKDSSNSSKPPSAAHPHDKPPSSKSRSGRKRGGQPNYLGSPRKDRGSIANPQSSGDYYSWQPTERWSVYGGRQNTVAP